MTAPATRASHGGWRSGAGTRRHAGLPCSLARRAGLPPTLPPPPRLPSAVLRPSTATRDGHVARSRLATPLLPQHRLAHGARRRSRPPVATTETYWRQSRVSPESPARGTQVPEIRGRRARLSLETRQRPTGASPELRARGARSSPAIPGRLAGLSPETERRHSRDARVHLRRHAEDPWARLRCCHGHAPRAPGRDTAVYRATARGAPLDVA